MKPVFFHSDLSGMFVDNSQYGTLGIEYKESNGWFWVRKHGDMGSFVVSPQGILVKDKGVLW